MLTKKTTGSKVVENDAPPKLLWPPVTLTFDLLTPKLIASCTCLIEEGEKQVDLYSAFIVVPHSQGAQVWITQCYLQITSYLPLPRKHSPDDASPDWGCGHLIAAYYSFIYPERTKGWVSDLQQTVYPHKWSPVSRRSSAGQRKFACQRLTFYHCTTQPTNDGSCCCR